MINAYRTDQGHLRPVSPLPEDMSDLVWLDLMEPTKHEERLVEKSLAIGVHLRRELRCDWPPESLP